MSLDTDLVRVEKDGKRSPSPTYRGKTIVDSVERLEKLRETDLTTPEGLAEYKKLTGDNPSEYSPDKIDFRKSVRTTGGQQDLGAYVDRHFGKVIEELDDETRVNLGYKYCPTKDIEGNRSPYNAVRKIVAATKEKVKAITEDPDTYLAQALKAETPLMRSYIAQFRKEFLSLEQTEAQRNAALALAHYDSGHVGRFLRVTHGHLKSRETALATAQKDIEKRMTLKLETAETNKDEILSASETAALLSDLSKEMQEAHEKYADVANLKPLTQETTLFAVDAISKKSKAP